MKETFDLARITLPTLYINEQRNRFYIIKDGFVYEVKTILEAMELIENNLLTNQNENTTSR